jgi:hypothetical protein
MLSKLTSEPNFAPFSLVSALDWTEMSEFSFWPTVGSVPL